MNPSRLLPILVVFLLAGCWGSPSSRGKEGQPCPPAPSTPTAPTFCVITRDGWLIQGVERNATAAKVVLFVTGVNEDHRSFDIPARRLAAAGFHVVSIDSRGMGQSVNRSGAAPRAWGSFSDSDFMAMERDIDAVAARLHRAPDLIVGASIGANEAIRYAARTPGVSTVIMLSPGIDYHGVTSSDGNKAFAGRVDYMASQEDTYSASTVAELYPAHAGAKAQKIWQGKGHGTQMLDGDGLDLLLAWVHSALNPTPTSSTAA